MKKKFAEWLSRQFNNQLAMGKKVEDVEMKFPLTTIKPIHASWITDFYDHMSTEEGTKIIVNGWKASGILDAVRGGSAELSPIDPFQDISPLPSIPDQRDTAIYRCRNPMSWISSTNRLMTTKMNQIGRMKTASLRETHLTL